MFIIIDIILVLSCVLILSNFRRGFFLYILLGLIIPHFVSFKFGGININKNDLLLLFLAMSFFIHRNKLTKDFQNKSIRKLLSIYVFSTLILTVLASYVPFPVQLYGFIKGVLFQEVMPVIFAFYAFSDVKLDKTVISKVFSWLVILIGVYGILCYITQENPYIKILNLLYLDEYQFDYFLTETRGGLTGRVSGTVNHPLAWGQLWNILLAFFILNRKYLSNVKFYSVVVLSCLNILFSGSRSAIVAIFPVIFCYIMSDGINKKYLFRFFILFILFIGISFTLPPKVQTYIKSAIFFWDESVSQSANIQGSNVEMRMQQLEMTMDEINGENLLAGYGLGYRAYSEKKNMRNTDMLGFESIVFSKMYEQGLIGLICFFYYIYQLYLLGIKVMPSKKKILFLGYFMSYLLSILFTGIQNTWGNFVILGLLIISLEKAEQKLYACDSKNLA